MDNRLSISEVRCSYFDSAVLGGIKKTATRIYKLFEIVIYLEDGGSFTQNQKPCKIRKEKLGLTPTQYRREAQMECLE